ncbi:PREDICTED: uncharacterized protein LOC109349892 isoform X2 [Lupinus angustifolius]|uniref:uncharacterized protein LOC109349892 isoform X2 n=1 Tax=Lupinus angustifolius TaxID=3871 RepID=UPI00092F772A|nr:PREDICTED: uncharacterized protein LOC109349892 isoform X2 [Lupinus angustifolius]
MGDSKRWTVTYTKHLKQKRKVYQDGFLQLHVSTNKVMLYDECEKLLVCKVLKKEESVTSGETLELNGYLVDIGVPEGHNNPQPDSSVDYRKHNTGSRFKTPCNTKLNSKESSAQPRRPISPSQKIIKVVLPIIRITVQSCNVYIIVANIAEFKKRELLKYVSPKISPETTKPSTTEYQVLYTTQVTQKAKKYHDGFLQLVIRGSHGEQVMLFDASRKLLHSRYLKKDDIIKPGESIAFDAYLVDVGERQGSHIPASSVQGNNLSGVERMENDRQQPSVDTDTHAPVGKSEWQVSYTAQLTQKAKKYHDGFLQLEFCGSHGRQVVLYDLSKRPLERRFLKKDEVIRAGESVRFDGHLVDVGEPEGSHQSPVKLNEQDTGNRVIERRKLRQGLNNHLKVFPSIARGQSPSKPCLGQDAGLNSQITMEEKKSNRIVPPIKSSCDGSFGQDAGLNSPFTMEEKKSNPIVPPVKPLRDASQILSFLQGPMPQENVTGGGFLERSCQNIMDRESTEIMKAPDIASSKEHCGGGFQFTENIKMSNQLHQDKEAQTNMSEADTDTGLSILSSGGHSCLNSSEYKSAEEFSCKTELFPSFDLGF